MGEELPASVVCVVCCLWAVMVGARKLLTQWHCRAQEGLLDAQHEASRQLHRQRADVDSIESAILAAKERLLRLQSAATRCETVLKGVSAKECELKEDHTNMVAACQKLTSEHDVVVAGYEQRLDSIATQCRSLDDECDAMKQSIADVEQRMWSCTDSHITSTQDNKLQMEDGAAAANQRLEDEDEALSAMHRDLQLLRRTGDYLSDTLRSVWEDQYDPLANQSREKSARVLELEEALSCLDSIPDFINHAEQLKKQTEEVRTKKNSVLAELKEGCVH